MTELLTALRQIAPTLEKELQGRLASFAGMFIVGYLPQTWAFVTKEERAALSVDKKGIVLVEPGTPPSPDITVEGGRESLVAALLRQPRTKLPGDPPLLVTPHTPKGKTAYDLLKGRFGL